MRDLVVASLTSGFDPPLQPYRLAVDVITHSNNSRDSALPIKVGHLLVGTRIEVAAKEKEERSPEASGELL
jgi:hypothetical protein